VSLIITNAGKEKSLSCFVGKDTQQETLILKLYSNNYTPTILDEVQSYTEVTGGGYVSKSLVPSNWTIDAGLAGYPQQVWTFTGSSGSVYGYYVVSSTSNTLLFAEKFPNGPYTVSTSGDIIRVTISLSLI
jgi:hypothetical protein